MPNMCSCNNSRSSTGTKSLPLSLQQLFFDQPAVTLHQKRPGAAGGIQDPHPFGKRQRRLHLVEDEVDQRNRRIVCARVFAPPLRMQELLVDDRKGLDGDVREIVVFKEVPWPFGDHRRKMPPATCLTCSASTPCFQGISNTEPLSQSSSLLDQRPERSQLSVAAENRSLLDLKLSEPLCRENIAVAEITQVDVLANQGVRSLGIGVSFFREGPGPVALRLIRATANRPACRA